MSPSPVAITTSVSLFFATSTLAASVASVDLTTVNSSLVASPTYPATKLANDEAVAFTLNVVPGATVAATDTTFPFTVIPSTGVTNDNVPTVSNSTELPANTSCPSVFASKDNGETTFLNNNTKIWLTILYLMIQVLRLS